MYLLTRRCGGPSGGIRRRVGAQRRPDAAPSVRSACPWPFRLWSPSVATADRAWSHSSGSTSGRGPARWIRPRVVMMAPLW